MVVALGGTTYAAALNTGAATSTITSVVADGSPMYVRACGFMGGGSGNTLSTVVWDAASANQSFTRAAQSGISNGTDRAEIWKIAAPTAKTATITLTFTGGNSWTGRAACHLVTGQDATTPDGTAVVKASGANGTSIAATAISGMASGDLLLAVTVDGNGSAITPSQVGGTTLAEQYDNADGGEESEGFTVTDACTSVNATFTSTSWAFAAIPLKTTAAPADPFPAGYRLGRFQPPNRLTLFAR